MSGWRLSALLLAAVALAALADSECPLAPATPQDRRSDPNRLRVVQFNAGNCCYTAVMQLSLHSRATDVIVHVLAMRRVAVH